MSGFIRAAFVAASLLAGTSAQAAYTLNPGQTLDFSFFSSPIPSFSLAASASAPANYTVTVYSFLASDTRYCDKPPLYPQRCINGFYPGASKTLTAGTTQIYSNYVPDYIPTFDGRYSGFLRFENASSVLDIAVPFLNGTPPSILPFLAASAVPEPTTWALMLAGFGMVSYAMRRRRLQIVYA